MSLVVLIIHLLACIGLILVVLLQTGKGASMGAAFGGASQTVFGSAGASSFLSRMTTAMAVVFVLTSIGLTVLGTGGPSSVMNTPPAPATQSSAPPPAALPPVEMPEKAPAQAAEAPAAPAAPAEQAAPAAPPAAEAPAPPAAPQNSGSESGAKK
ncbi:MAG: preprotein translocase subunit SecG [Deltaproteobacteria bacterium]|nr:preprotein translocase subunit SecG [Deltaproteobacteria bacterium]